MGSSRKGGTTPIHAESGCDYQTIDSMDITKHAVKGQPTKIFWVFVGFRDIIIVAIEW